MTTAVTVRRGGAGDAIAAAGVLALSAAMTLLVPLLGVVRAADGSPTWSAPGALWVTVLPALLTVALAARRPVAAVAVAAGAGLMGAVRLLADLPVVTSPDSLARPDLFVETTDRSLPFHAAAGGYLLLAADAVALAAGVFAAVRLAGRLSFQRRSDLSSARSPGVTGDETRGAAGAAGSGPDDVRSEAGDDAGGAGEFGPRRNNVMIAAGFVGVLLLAVGALAVPYQGGYLAGRYVAVGVPLAGLVAAVLLAVIGATAVLVGGSLPRSLAVALLGGVALGACLPLLACLAAVVTAPVQLSVTVWLGLAGGVLLAAAGLLARVLMVRTGEPDAAAAPVTDTPVTAPSRVTAVLAGVAGLVAAALAAAAFALPSLNAGGLQDLLVLTDGSPVPGSTLFGAAAIPLAVAGVLALVPRTASAARGALMVLWAGLVPAVTTALQVLGDDVISTARLMNLVGIGAGTWCGVAALALAGAAAVLAAVTSHRAAEASAMVPDDDSVAAARSVTVPLAVGLAVLAVVAALLPVYGTAGQAQGPTILRGYDVQAWGVWALLVATVGALAGAAATRRRWVALALGLAAAAVQAVRLVVPSAVPQSPGFGLRAGVVVQGVLVLVLIGGAVVFGFRAGRVREIDAAGYDAPFTGGWPPVPAGVPGGALGPSAPGVPTGMPGQASSEHAGRARPDRGSTRPVRPGGAGSPRRPSQRSRRKRR